MMTLDDKRRTILEFLTDLHERGVAVIIDGERMTFAKALRLAADYVPVGGNE